MLQLFLKTTQITPDGWAAAYQKIGELTAAFPLKLLRIEAYNGYEPQQDKDHFDLIENPGTDDECLSFYGDFMTYTAGTTIRFYKNWDKHRQLALKPGVSDPSKPITWAEPTPFKNDGSVPVANGESTEYGYIDVRGGRYQYAILAIGILLENMLPGRAFLTAPDQTVEHIDCVTEWLEGHFGEIFDRPVYFDKKRLLASFQVHYPDKADAVERLEHLYRTQFKRNMIFALEHLGYESTFRVYAKILSNTLFGTFGFWDVLNAWIAAVQDLENTLQLVAESKRLLVERGAEEEAKKYDLGRILSSLLDDFVLWTPLQREELAHFYTNEQALETGEEDLLGAIFRMAGLRVDICPIVATPDELFEAFMYHYPKNGAIFKKIIEDWQEKSADVFEELKKKLAWTSHSENTNDEEHDDEDHDDEGHHETHPGLDENTILSQFPAHEHFFIRLVMQANPAYFLLHKSLNDLRERLLTTIEGAKNRNYVQQIRAESNDKKKALIRQQIKQMRSIMAVGPSFEQWLDNETDEQVLLHLRLLTCMKIYDRERAYARYRILHDATLWEVWRKPGGAA